jgi:acetoin utilization deacetylase AcuC-like enzyme
MILYDPGLVMGFKEYGIMLPISPSRAEKIVDFLFREGRAKGPLVEPVLDIPGALRFLEKDGLREEKLPGEGASIIHREDLERVHQAEFVADLYGDGPAGVKGLEKTLLRTWELIDSQGRPNRYEPDKAVRPLEELFQKALNQVGGTYLAARLALTGGVMLRGSRTGTPESGSQRDGNSAPAPGFCFYLGGGMHHARYDGGSGFCLLNDIMIAARRLQAENRARLIWIVDVDVHKGDGTAELIRFARERGELGAARRDGQTGEAGREIFNLSIHMARGWPLDEESLNAARNASSGGKDRAPLIPGDVEIPIESGAEDTYIPELGWGLRRLEELSRAAADSGAFPGGATPDLVIVVDGADPYEHDGLPSSGLMKLTLDQCLARDRLIFDYLRERGLPSAWIMAGGYGERAWEPTANFLKNLGI